LHVSGPRDYCEALTRAPRRHVIGEDNLLDRIVNSKSPLRISITDSDSVLLQAHQRRMERLLGAAPVYVNESINVPLIMREQVCGYMQINGVAQRRYTDTTLSLAQAFGNLIGASIEKAQLYERAMQSATLSERGRIARELHDSVSQALFGIVLGMRTIIQLSQQGHEAPPDTFDYVYKLAEAALSETRALVFELRPEYLEKEGLIAAFAKQAQTLCARHQIQVNTMMCATEPDIPFKAKEAIYRMALEAVQNTIKHARATKVDLRMHQTDGLLMIEVQDNGRGFDASRTPDGHFGVKTMRERAAHIGAMLDLRTEPGHGTLVRITLPVPGTPDCAN
jgi:signal transduction histidine kinase